MPLNGAQSVGGRLSAWHPRQYPGSIVDTALEKGHVRNARYWLGK
jgi:hypothetical protein